VNNVRPLQLAVLHILDHAGQYDWSVQGFGMLRLYIRKIGRLHIWDDRLRYPGVSMIHTHSWDLRSTIVSGNVRNTRFEEMDVIGLPYHKQRLVTGFQAHMVSEAKTVRLLNHPAEWYEPGDVYRQAGHEIHLTDAANGTITLMERREDENGEADIYWPLGESWGTATPKVATLKEILDTTAYAKEILLASLGCDVEFHEAHEPEDCRICIDNEIRRRLEIRSFKRWQVEASNRRLFEPIAQAFNHIVRAFKREAQRG
jgi:hypothetical protein